MERISGMTRILFRLMILTFFAFYCGQANAQNTIAKRQAQQENAVFNAVIEAGKTATFEQVMQDPDNIKLNLAYAKAQVKRGEVKGAAATLERMLRINPKLNEVRLFYAAILYRLDNIAESKIQLAKLDKEELSAKTEFEKDTLAKLIARREKKTLWTGQVAAGMIYDTNKNAFWEGDAGDVQFGDFIIPGEELDFGKKQSDNATLALASLDMEHKMGHYAKHSVFAGGSYYTNRQSDLNAYDMAVISAKAGFNFNTLNNTFTPQVSYNVINLDGKSYMDTAAFSLRVNHPTSKITAIYAEGKYTSMSYKDSEDYVRNSDKNGGIISATAGFRRLLGPRMTIEAEATGASKGAKEDYYKTTSYGLAVRHFWLLGKNTYIMTGVSANKENYKEINPTDSFFVEFGDKKREDTIVRATLNFGCQLFKGINFNAGYEYLSNGSNLKNHKYSNHKVTGMLGWKFSI